MKKVCKLFLVLLIALVVFGCSSNGGNTPIKSKKIIEDVDLMKLHFEAPETYDSVDRYCDYLADGTLYEKDINIYFSNDDSISFAYLPNIDLNDLTDTSGLDKIEHDGKDIYLIESSDSKYGFVQIDNDLYGISYQITDENNPSFDQIVEGIKYTDNSELILDDIDLEDIEYKFDESWNNTEYTIRNTENVEGEIIKKQVTWYFGKDKDNTDFSFMIRIHKNQKLEDVLNEDNEYIDKEVAGIQYKALKTDEASEYVYYTEHNNDVYEIRNAGTISLWWANRSDESRVAFDTFLNSISFKK